MKSSPTSYIDIYRAANSVEAHLVRGLLQHHGIDARVVGEGLSSGIGELPLDVVEVSVQVPAGFKMLARQLIGEYERQRQMPASDSVGWRCSNCGERCPEEFAACWNCSAARSGGSDAEQC